MLPSYGPGKKPKDTVVGLEEEPHEVGTSPHLRRAVIHLKDT